MRRSANEMAMLALKAGRGAGVPLAQAQDMATAVALVAADCPQALPALADVYAGPIAALAVADDGALQGCPSLCLPAALDLLAAGRSSVTLAKAPPDALLCAAQALAVAQYRIGFETLAAGDGVVLRKVAADARAATAQSAEVDETTWAKLTDLAGRTHVPATEASRQSGAGAGLTDND